MRAAIFDVTIEHMYDMGVQDTRHFKLRFPEGAEFSFDAGQFINILMDSPETGKVVKRPYSIASPPLWKGYLDLCWKRVEGGLVTNWLRTKKTGDLLKIQGPLGRFTVKTPLPKTILFISTGTGIAPFRSMIHVLLEQKAPCEIWNIFGNRYETDILYQEEFLGLEKQYPNFHNVLTISRPQTWTGEKSYVQHMLKKYHPDPAGKHVYICGLTSMIDEVHKTALELGYQKDQIFFEKYD